MNDKLKEGEDILFHRGPMLASGTVFKIMDDLTIIVETGNGGRGLEYVKKTNIVRI